MSQTHFYTCDICGKEGPARKQYFNLSRDELPKDWRHWSVQHPDPGNGLFDAKWRSVDVCSEDCLRQAMQRYLDGIPASEKS